MYGVHSRAWSCGWVTYITTCFCMFGPDGACVGACDTSEAFITAAAFTTGNINVHRRGDQDRDLVFILTSLSTKFTRPRRIADSARTT